MGPREVLVGMMKAVEQGVGGERGGAEGLHQQGERHDGLAVAPVGDLARGQCEQEEREELRQPDHADEEGGLGHGAGLAGDGVDLPAQRHGLGLRAEDGGEARAPEQAEVSVPEGIEGLGPHQAGCMAQTGSQAQPASR
jgi:hypothetical protein